jgi:hypothetical protein
VEPEGLGTPHFSVLEIAPYTKDVQNAGVSSLILRKTANLPDGLSVA